MPSDGANRQLTSSARQPRDHPTSSGRLMRDPLGPQFDVSVQRLRATAIVRATGELDVETAPVLANVLRELDRPCRRVILDLSELTFIDSSGLALAVSEQQRSANDGFDFVVAGASGNVLEVMRLTGLDSTLPLAPDVEMALGDGTTLR
jgi:anti-sigma B factor antagonist